MVQRRASFTDSGLHRALRRRELSLFYQPQFTLADNRLCGVEALLRWQTRYDGIKLPGEFIPAAEHSGLITDIGGFVLDSACAQYAEWARAGIAPRMFSVNVSVQQLKDSNFVRMVQGALQQHGIAPASLELELVESALADAEVEEPLRALANLGVKLALDDFGTGYSSLNYLRRYPVNTVKLDRSFLDEVPQNDSAGALVESVITMAHTLGKRVTSNTRNEPVDVIKMSTYCLRRVCRETDRSFDNKRRRNHKRKSRNISPRKAHQHVNRLETRLDQTRGDGDSERGF